MRATEMLASLTAATAVLATTAKVAARAEPLFLTNLTEPFSIDGSSLPNFPFDIGESYAGLLSVSTNQTDDQKLWFWFFPSTNPAATDEVLVWFSGGPGCAGTTGLFYENGPFQWADGTLEPVVNPWAWTNLTNVLWVDQPIGTGYSTGQPTANNLKGVAHQFLGFWKNFVDTFALHDADIYLAGESYGGRFVSYIGHAMLQKNDTEYYNLQSTMFVDALIADHQVQQDVVLAPYVDHWNVVLNLNDTYLDTIHSAQSACGYEAYLDENFVFPGNPDANTTVPEGYYTHDGATHKCSDLTEAVKDAIILLNPCFEAIHITGICPTLFSIIGYPTFVTGGLKKRVYGAYVGEIYLDRQDVKELLNAPLTDWAQCNQTGISADGNGLTSTQPIIGNLPELIEGSKRTIITHGALDMQLIPNGTLLAIQQMNWSGAQGFSKAPTDTFIVPAFSDKSTAGSSGSSGKVITERGLTYIEVSGSGHEVPQYAPSASYRQVEYLLGRVDTLTDAIPFTTDPNQ